MERTGEKGKKGGREMKGNQWTKKEIVEKKGVKSAGRGKKESR